LTRGRGFLRNCFVGEPLALAAHDRARGALLVSDAKRLASVVPEVEFGKVVVQVLLVAMLVDAAHAALEHREEAFDGVGGHVAPRIFLLGVVHGLVGHEVRANPLVHAVLVGVQAAFLGDVLANDAGHLGGIGTLDVERANLAATLDQREDAALEAGVLSGIFAAAGLRGTVGRQVAKVGFVNLHDLASAAQRATLAAFGHGVSDTVGQVPSGLHAALEHALDLTGADALLGRAHEVDDLKPQVQRQVAILKDRANADSERLAAGVALAQAGPGGLAVQAADALPLAAMGADRATRPQVAFDILESGVFILELRGGKDRISHDILQ
jgi:hypothetical protein